MLIATSERKLLQCCSATGEFSRSSYRSASQYHRALTLFFVAHHSGRKSPRATSQLASRTDQAFDSDEELSHKSDVSIVLHKVTIIS